MFDADTGNTNWKDEELLELKQIYNFGPFDSISPVNNASIPPGHTKTQLHLIYYYKTFERYKAHMLASSNMTGPNINTYYYIVTSLRSMFTIFYLSELNNIETYADDISNSYLTTCNNEKIVFSSGRKFSPFGHIGHLILIKTVLYGIKSSVASFHSWLSDALSAFRFVPSMEWCDIWVRNEWEYYSYVDFYCDDIIVVHKDPEHVF